MYDLAIINGCVVRSSGSVYLDIGISEGIITAIELPGTLGDAKQIFDAQGCYVMPGGIDTHVHMNDLGAEELGEWPEVSWEAINGGITTVVDMPIDNVPATISQQALELKLDRIHERSYVDYLLWGGLTTNNLEQIPELMKSGVAGLKSFLVDSGAEDFVRTTDPILLEGMKLVAKAGIPLVIHAENNELNSYYTQKYKGLNNWKYWGQMHPEVSELEAVSKSILFAELTGAKIHIAHISSAKSVRMISMAKQRGVNVTCETCPHYLLFSEEDYTTKGALLKCAPPVRSEQNRLELWEEVKKGNIDLIVSDYSPNPEKRASDSVDTAWAGINEIANTIVAMYSCGCIERELTIEQLVQMCSENAAKLVGVEMSKGSIEIGKDGDLVVLNPNRTTVGKNGIYRDVTFCGEIIQVFLHGRCIKEKNPQGCYIRRRIDESKFELVIDN